MRPQDRAKITEWYERIVYLGQMQEPWKAISSAQAVVPPEEAFRQFVFREIKERETETVDVKALDEKLRNYVAHCQKSTLWGD